MERGQKLQQLIELKEAVTDLGTGVIQVARGGNSEKVSRVHEILSRIKCEIYTILSE